MAQYQFENSADAGSGAAAFAQSSMNWLVRLAGLVLLGVGLWAAIGVINEAWAIYNAPRQSRVDAIAVAIDEATHVDSVLSPPARADVSNADPTKPAAKPMESFRLSYFIAWPIVMLLLLLVGRLSMAAIKTGGELALFDVQFRRFARDLVREVARSQKS
ncbi:MAG: hypothetical protein U1F34_00810 [Gammaproteobacteria bacterium]